MIRTWFSVLAVAGLASAAPGCGYNQHLVSIQVQPSGAIFGGADPALVVNFKAYGTYIHPPATKDITDQVTWQSDTPQVATVTSTGAVHPATNCGTSNVTASFYDSPNQVVSNSATITVDGPAAENCPTTQP